MEDLNKNQIVLLVLLVSIVTSMATGIVTVVLLGQSEPGVIQTINRVVEKTIERVVPGEVKTTTVVKEIPVAVSEEEQVVGVINRASPGVVAIFAPGDIFLGAGFVISETGLVVIAEPLLAPPPAENGAVPAAPPPDKYAAVLSGGKSVTAWRVKTSVEKGVALLRLDVGALQEAGQSPPNIGSATPVLSVLKLAADGAVVSLGQKLIGLGRRDTGLVSVAFGIVSAISQKDDRPSEIRTVAADAANLGGPLLNLRGEVVGLAASAGSGLPAGFIREAIDAIIQS